MATVPLGGGNLSKLTAFPGFHKWQDRSMIFRNTGANLNWVEKNWPEASWIGGAEDIIEEHRRKSREAEETIKSKEESLPSPEGDLFPYKRQPMEHQRKGFLLSRDRESFALLMEQGTGKTKVTLDTAQWLFLEGKIEALIIVAWPNGVHRNWIEYEIPEDVFLPFKADFWSSNWKSKSRQKAYRDLIEKTPKDHLRIFSFNVEAFVSPGAQALILELLEKFKTLLVIDQSASIKNHSANRSKFLIEEAAPLAKYRRILDGQPVAEGGHELFSQFKFLDQNIIGHDTWTGFKNEFCETGYFREISGYKNLEELHRRIDGYCYRALADDCLDLPPRVYRRWAFDLSSEEERIWGEMRKKSLAFFEEIDWEKIEELEEDVAEEILRNSERLQEKMALVKNLRLQQISSGWWPAEDFRSIESTPSRLSALLSLLEATEGKSLIFSRFRADLDIIAKALGEEAVSYRGGMSDEAKEDAKRQFMTNPKVKYFIGQPRTAGIGHTLTAASNVIFYSNDPSLRFREECEKRAHRQGQKADRLFIWDLIASRTHDSKIVKTLQEKKNVANEILRDPSGFFLVEGEGS